MDQNPKQKPFVDTPEKDGAQDRVDGVKEKLAKKKEAAEKNLNKKGFRRNR